MSRPRIEPGPSEHSRKEPSRQLVNGFSEHLHMSLQHGSPQCMCYMNILYINTHELHWDVGRIALVRRMACCLADALQVLCVSNHVRVSTIERLDQSHHCPNLEVPGLTRPGRVGSENSRKEPSRQLVNGYSEHLHMSLRQSNPFYL
jgi:hypothetical protein